MLKSCQIEIAPTLTHIVNLSMHKRAFPSAWKLSKVTPLHKSGSWDDCNNYRPIAILSTVSKVLERLVHQQCTAYLTSYGILSEAQSGLRGGRSMDTCLIEFLNNIYCGINAGGVCGAVFLDLAKAFDTVNHDILVEKLSNMGFRYGVRRWFPHICPDMYNKLRWRVNYQLPGR